MKQTIMKRLNKKKNILKYIKKKFFIYYYLLFLKKINYFKYSLNFIINERRKQFCK